MDRPELLQLYEVAIAEYRFNVQLSWDRLKFFVGLNLALIAALGFGPSSVPIAVGYLAGAITSALGALVVRKAHGYYQATRRHFQALERDLGLGALGLSTTPGMIGGSALHRLRIVDACSIVLGMLVLFDLAMAARILLR